MLPNLLCITFNRDLSPIIFNYSVNEKNLGILLYAKPDFQLHYDNIVNRSFKLLGFLCRNARDIRDIRCTFLYISLGCSTLEHLTTVCFPIYPIHFTTLESIQNRYFKILSFKLNVPVTCEVM